jgi:hypothetical protein
VQGLDERIGEHLDVPGHLPHPAGKNDGRVDADDVIAPLDDRLPPLLLDVLLERRAERPVVPGRPRSPVDLSRLEDEAPALGEVDDGVEIAELDARSKYR